MDQITLGLQGAYLGIGAVFAGYILARTWWDHWKTAVPGAVCALLVVWLWLPAIIVIGLVVWWAFWSRARTVRRRNAKLDALKDKHGIDDAEVMARFD